MNTARIPQLKRLTHHLYRWFPTLTKNNQPGLFLTYGVAIFLSIPSVSVAQSAGTLPPPPPLRVPKNAVPPASTQPSPEFTNSIPVKAVPVTPKPASTVREYTFQAPSSLPSSTPITPSKTRISDPSPQRNGTPNLYRVEVAGQDTSILSQVQVIEPLAFIRQSEGVIHAGMFQQSQQAQQRVLELQREGVSATVVPVYENQRTNDSGSTRRFVRP